MNPPASKFQIIQFPQLPGTCIACGKNSGGEARFLDFQFSIDYYGAVYFCLECCAEIAQSIDFVKSDEADQLRDLLTVAHNQLNRTEQQLEYYTNLANSLSIVRPDLLINDDVLDSPHEAGESITEGSDSGSSEQDSE